MRKLRFVFALRFIFALFLAFPVFLTAQTNSGEDIFTISVAAPVSPKDVQVRYFVNGDPAIQQASSIAKPDDERIVVKTSVEDKSAKGFRAIAYLPGCQFFTIQVDDLSTSAHRADFQCQKLLTTPLQGRADLSKFAGKDLQVEALYSCTWAGQFFGVPNIAISPFSVAKVKVESDGTFAVDMPDFSSDPLWANLSHNATLMFFLVDAQSGERLARLAAPRDLSREGALKIATSYPMGIQFTVK
jgi:hypothetical protein